MTKHKLYKLLHTVIGCNDLEQEDKLEAVNAILSCYGVHYKTTPKFLSDNIFEDLFHKALEEYGSVEQVFYNEFSCIAMEREFERFGELCDKCLNFGGINCSVRMADGSLTFGQMELQRKETYKRSFISTLYPER